MRGRTFPFWAAAAAAVFLAAAGARAVDADVAAQARTWLAAGRVAEAVPALEGALARDGGDFPVQFYLAYCYGRQGRWPEARRLWERCAALEPDCAAVRYNLGVALNELGAYDAAAGAFEEVLLVDPGYANASYGCGVAYYYGGQPVRAIKHLREARALTPGAPDAAFYLALAYEEIDRRVAAATWAEYLALAADNAAEQPYVATARRHLEVLRGTGKP